MSRSERDSITDSIVMMQRAIGENAAQIKACRFLLQTLGVTPKRFDDVGCFRPDKPRRNSAVGSS